MEMGTAPVRVVLMVTSKDGADRFGAALSKGAGVVVEVVRSKRAALALLRRQQFAAIVVDTGLREAEKTSTDMLWQNTSGALPLEVDLGAFGLTSLTRLLRSVLDGREKSEEKLRESVKQTMSDDLRSTLTGLLLQSDMALRDKALTPAIEYRVRELRALADDLRSRYRPAY